MLSVPIPAIEQGDSLVAPHTAPSPAGPVRADHSHIWQLPDGTGLHAPFATLAFDAEAGQVFCHLCGRGFRHLGAHVRVHGHTAESYRGLIGLRRRIALTVPDLSATISARQRRVYYADDAVRARFAPGQEMARTGRLTWLSRKATDTPQRTAERREHLAAGRDRVELLRRERLARVLHDAGAMDLADYLRRRYSEGADLAQLARETGLGRARLRAQLDLAGVRVRATGQNTAAGKQSRIAAADRRAAHRVGAVDICDWIATRRAEGATLATLAAQTERSIPWVRSRVARRSS